VIPATLELVDRRSLAAVSEYLGGRSLAPAGTGALLLIEVDGLPGTSGARSERVERACRDAGATEILRAASDRRAGGALGRQTGDFYALKIIPR
jgi:FAD/FMN-containing dehydrogenase